MRLPGILIHLFPTPVHGSQALAIGTPAAGPQPAAGNPLPLLQKPQAPPPALPAAAPRVLATAANTGALPFEQQQVRGPPRGSEMIHQYPPALI